MVGLLRKFFDTNEKEIKRLKPFADLVNGFEAEMKLLSDAELRGKTDAFKGRLADGETVDDILPEAFAVVREAAWRTVNMRHFDVQIMGGVVLHQGRIAEMKTGEGKTLVATLPVYLNALTGKGVHVVTVNDYLAKRDAEWMGAVYEFLGLSVGVIVHGLSFDERRQAYGADITYGTNNEFGFDYLRDNMVTHRSQMVQRDLHYAIVDEVDSILIDEARTPLIISGPGEQSTELYQRFARIVPKLRDEEDFTVDEKARTATLTDEGLEKVEKALGVETLFDETHFEWNHYLNQAMKAQTLFKKDRDYVVKDGQVIIVDEFTGRLMEGRRYSDGLHQAIEAKEGVKVEAENQTLAAITFQNYFRMYDKLAGMTGTAETEEAEFRKIYGMDVVVVPTNEPMIREDLPDLVYKTTTGKFDAAVEEIVECHARKQPVLVGTISIERSEELSRKLKKRGVPHEVLNAKYHEKEAHIVAQAGRLGQVTISTNMAGRGTDIVLGGNPDFLAREKLAQMGYQPEVLAEVAEKTPPSNQEVADARETYRRLYEEIKHQTDAEREQVLAAGGLHIMGTERHESRRIDNQLRGRSGRQGDPGSSRFFVSLEDDLMRLFGSGRITGLMDRLGWEDDQPIEHNQISKAIENAQRKVESHHFEIRKQVLEYDDVMNRQREVIYGLRRNIVMGQDVKDRIQEYLGEVLDTILAVYADEKTYPEDWDRAAMTDWFNELINATRLEPADLESIDNRESLKEKFLTEAQAAYADREAELGPETTREVERLVLLQFIDSRWMTHLRAMDDLREGIGLRAYGQKDPLLEYKFAGFEMFKAMMDGIKEDVIKSIFRVQVNQDRSERQRIEAEQARRLAQVQTNRSSDGSVNDSTVVQRRVTNKVGRNDPCPCGSGKKYKKCCGAAV